MRYVAARIVMARKIIKATGTILRYGARVLTCVSECCVCVQNQVRDTYGD